MSNVKISGNASGTGTLTIAAPNTNTDRTLTLPDNTGTFITTGSSGNAVPVAALPKGSVIQVVSATYSTATSSSSSTYSDTGLTATITPTSASSKILVLVNQTGCSKETGNTYIAFSLLRGVTSIAVFENGAGYTNSTASNFIGTCGTAYLDSPATTSATTYKTQFKSSSNIAVVGCQNNSSTSTITLMEIAA